MCNHIHNIDYEYERKIKSQKPIKVLQKILREEKQKIAFVGDGINDSPVLARADIGISMGGIGSSSAIEASDVVIMTDELSKIVEAIDISKKTNKVIKQNLVFSIGVKVSLISIGVSLLNFIISLILSYKDFYKIII